MTEDTCRHSTIGYKILGGFPGHEHSHPAGPQACLECGETLEEILRATGLAAARGMRERCEMACYGDPDPDDPDGCPDTWDWHQKDFARAIRNVPLEEEK